MTEPESSVAHEAVALAAFVQAMAAGDDAALAGFYDATSRRVYGLVLGIVQDPTAAEEVTLDVYLEAWRKAAGYDPGRGSPLAWLITVARSRAIDRARLLRTDRRRRAQEPPGGEPAVAENFLPDQAAGDDQRARLVRTALDRLPLEQRQAVALAYYQGLSHGEIAARLDLPLGTVKTRLRCALARLHEILAPQLSEEEP